jgi:predicted nucleic acid-binding protein
MSSLIALQSSTTVEDHSSQFDCQIAAIARARMATVATRSTSDYEGCGIELIDPWV